MKKKLKLYVWTEFKVDYTPGLAFAIADSEDEAKKMLEKKGVRVFGGNYSCWGDLTVHPLTKKIAEFVYGGG